MSVTLQFRHTKHVYEVSEYGMVIDVTFKGVPIDRTKIIVDREELVEFHAWLTRRINETWVRAPVASAVDRLK